MRFWGKKYTTTEFYLKYVHSLCYLIKYNSLSYFDLLLFFFFFFLSHHENILVMVQLFMNTIPWKFSPSLEFTACCPLTEGKNKQEYKLLDLHIFLRANNLNQFQYRIINILSMLPWEDSERLLLNDQTPGFLASGGDKFSPGPETRLDRSKLLFNKVLLKYKGDRESFWHRHQKGAERVRPC